MPLSPIQQVQKTFEQWRSQRKRRNEALPKHLWFRAFELEKSYSITEICQSLTLNSARYSHLRKELGGLPPYQPKKGKTKIQFVEALIEEQSKTLESDTLSITFKNKHGHEMHIQHTNMQWSDCFVLMHQFFKD